VRIVASEAGSTSSTTPRHRAGDLDRAFEAVLPMGPLRRRPPVGSGLGLAIVAELTKAMGGKVAVASEPGAGSTFSLLLPAEAPPPHANEGETLYVRLTQR
jgi:signal transduction histidine kinase